MATIRISRATLDALNNQFPDTKHSNAIALMAGQWHGNNRVTAGVLNHRNNTTVTVSDNCRTVVEKLKADMFRHPEERSLGDVIEVLVRGERW